MFRFNNGQKRDHLNLLWQRCFFDLDIIGSQAKDADRLRRELKIGDICIAATHDIVGDKRRRRWLIPAQGWSAANNPGTSNKTNFNPERVSLIWQGFKEFKPSGLTKRYAVHPGLSLRSNSGLELANAFGVKARSPLASVQKYYGK